MFNITEERSEIHSRLSELLKGCSIGDTVSYANILETSGLQMEQTRPMLYSVMSKLNKTQGLVFSNVFGVGYQRMSSTGLPEIGRGARRSINRKSRAARKTIVNALARTNDVDNDTRKRLNVEVGVLGLIELSSSTRSFNRISKAVGDDIAIQRHPNPSEISAALVSRLRQPKLSG